MGAGRRQVRAPRSLVLVSLVATVVMLGGPAWGHSFLVDTRPGQGERLTRSPHQVVFQFTEAVSSSSVEVDVTSASGGVIDAGRPEVESDGRVIRVPLLAPVERVAVVSWHVVSAIDGHESAGEFAFAVGETGQLPAATGTDSTGAAETAWRWVFLAGLSLAVGALVASATGQLDPSRWVVLARLGLVVAALGPTAVYLTTASRGFSAGRIGMGVAAILLATAALTTGERRRIIVLSLTGAAILAWASRSHTATVSGLLGVLADAAHLAGAALWFGTLALLVIDLRRARKGGGSLLAAARRYSHWVLRAVIVLAAAGVASALTVLTALSDLWTTGYGRILILKIALFAVALMLAAAGRWRALQARRVGLLRRLTTVEVIVVAGIVATSGILAATPPPALAQSETTLLGPPPIEGPVARAAGLAGNMTVAAHAGDGRIDLLVYNASTGGIEVGVLEASATLPDGTGVDLHPRPCGAGCLTQQLTLPDGTTNLTIDVSSREWIGGSVRLDLDWPPPSRQPEMLDQVIATMRDVDTLTLTETVSSGPGAEASSTATISGDTFIDLEVYSQGDIDQVSALPGRDDGVRLYLPGSRILIDLHLDAQQRILRERIVSPGHEITRDLTYP